MERATGTRWCPAHPYETARSCLGCASDHKAGDHRDQASPSCALCRKAAARRRPRHRQPALTLDVAALAAHDDTIADVIPLTPRSRRKTP